MRPEPRSRMCAPTTRQPRYVPRRFVASTSSHSSTSISQKERNSVRAALLTSTSTSPATSSRRSQDSTARTSCSIGVPPISAATVLGALEVQIGEQHAVAVRCEPARDRGAEPARCPGDDDCPGHLRRLGVDALLRVPERAAGAAIPRRQCLGQDRERRLRYGVGAEIEPARPRDPLERLFRDARLAQAVALLLLVAPAADQADVESVARERQFERRQVELVVVGEDDDRGGMVGGNCANASSGQATISSSALGIRSRVANFAARVGDDRRPAEQLRGGAERFGGVDSAVDEQARRRAVDLGEDLPPWSSSVRLRAPRISSSACSASSAGPSPAVSPPSTTSSFEPSPRPR